MTKADEAVETYIRREGRVWIRKGSRALRYRGPGEVQAVWFTNFLEQFATATSGCYPFSRSNQPHESNSTLCLSAAPVYYELPALLLLPGQSNSLIKCTANKACVGIHVPTWGTQSRNST